MSQYSYTTKPDWAADGKIVRSDAAALTYPSPMGWIQPAPWGGGLTIQSASTSGTVITVNCTGHGLVNGQSALITGTVGSLITDGYNGYVPAITYVTANQFTFPRVSTPGTATTTNGKTWTAIEVMAAISSLDTVYADAIVLPTYGTGVVTYPDGSAAMVTTNRMRITLTASEPVEVQGSPQIAVTIASNTRQAVFKPATSTSTALIFEYVVVAGDVATAGNISVAAATNGGYISDILPANKRARSTVTFTAPNTSTTTAN